MSDSSESQASRERRRHARQRTVRAIMVRPNGHRHAAQVLDLSRGGARMTLPQHWSPENGAALRIYFEGSSHDDEITLLGHVTRVGLDDMGVAFEPAQDERIRELFDSLDPRH